MDKEDQKRLGAYYTPDNVVHSLVRWVVHRRSDRMLDPACGDGRFLTAHRNSVGVERDLAVAGIVHDRAPGSLMHQGDFFSWAGKTCERFECAAGNPPFIRYQRFAGELRREALQLCAKHGARFSALASSWAPFIVAVATLLKNGGRMAFVVPAEIGHASYAKTVLEYLAGQFEKVQLIAVREKMFPGLSEDCWLLYAEGRGGNTDHLLFSSTPQVGFMAEPPSAAMRVGLTQWREWNCRVRPFLLPSNVRDMYAEVSSNAQSVRLHDVARVGIGYVTGDNGFFHLRPSEAQQAGIPGRFLQPTIRNGRMLRNGSITPSEVEAWRRSDEANFLLRLRPNEDIPNTVRSYLDSAGGREARMSYKCRNRQPWYVVPDVTVPDAFLAYMSANSPALAANLAQCTGTNSVHMVRLRGSMGLAELQGLWKDPFTALSCEIEGHPLGGGMLKLEPREAGRILLNRRAVRAKKESDAVLEGIAILREWRHCG